MWTEESMNVAWRDLMLNLERSLRQGCHYLRVDRRCTQQKRSETRWSARTPNIKEERNKLGHAKGPNDRKYQIQVAHTAYWHERLGLEAESLVRCMERKALKHQGYPVSQSDHFEAETQIYEKRHRK